MILSGVDVKPKLFIAGTRERKILEIALRNFPQTRVNSDWQYPWNESEVEEPVPQRL